ncbi:MAG: GAF domain-containing sensor histidine kinase [Acidobacteria bacterium]|nr:GAF domain-containing sensor histidine kinase [Acidobacteriota bacterium]
MHPLHQPEVLAEAAAGLSRQLQSLLHETSEKIQPILHRLDRRFHRRLKELEFTSDQAACLQEITLGAAAKALTAGGVIQGFLDTVRYRGRRLAKLELTPAQVVRALREYDGILNQALSQKLRSQLPDLEWLRGQLHFLVILTLNNAFYQVREAESKAFYELFRAEVESRSLQDLLPRFLEVLKVYTGAGAASIHLVDEHGWLAGAAAIPTDQEERIPLTPQFRRRLSRPVCLMVEKERKSAAASLILRESWRQGSQTVWSIPLLSAGRLQGVMQFEFGKPYTWLPREVGLLQAAAERCWLAAEKAKLLEHLSSREEKIRQLAEHMVEVEEAERRRISRELHDEAGQSLLCIRLQMEMLEQDLPPESAGVKTRLSDLRQMTEHTILEIRRLIAALSPAILEQMGLAAALRQLVGRFRGVHDAEVRIQLPRKLDLPKRVEIIVYRLVQEILNNIAKYSLASHVNLLVESADGYLRLHVEDNGVGFDVEEALSRRDCYGLSGLRERVALLGGRLAVRSRRKPGAGTTARTRTARSTGQVGIDLHGTSIWAELPLSDMGSAPSVPRSGERTQSRAIAPRRRRPA